MELQKASVLKRTAAWLLDAILTCVLAVGFAVLLSVVLRYDDHNAALQAGYDKYESQYGVVFEITSGEYEAMTQAERANYDTAYEALIADQDVLREYNLLINLSLVIVSVGILLGVLAMEFFVPLMLKNGQTVGKKAFGIGLVKKDGVKINTMQLFVRALLGKYTIETMIPVYILLMFFLGVMDMTGTIVLLALLVVQLICLIVTSTNSMIHDLMAGTVTVDISSQKVFQSTDELIAYTKRMAAERAKKQDY